MLGLGLELGCEVYSKVTPNIFQKRDQKVNVPKMTFDPTSF